MDAACTPLRHLVSGYEEIWERQGQLHARDAVVESRAAFAARVCASATRFVYRSGPPGEESSATGPRRKASSALLNHPTTPLADGTINASGDAIEVVLVQTADMPAAIRIVWPLQPTVADPRRFPETAAMIARLFAEASTALAQIKARKRL